MNFDKMNEAILKGLKNPDAQKILDDGFNLAAVFCRDHVNKEMTQEEKRLDEEFLGDKKFYGKYWKTDLLEEIINNMSDRVLKT